MDSKNTTRHTAVKACLAVKEIAKVRSNVLLSGPVAPTSAQYIRNFMSKTVVLVLEDIRSVENTASIFRTAEGLGVKKIILVGTTPAPIDRFGRKRNDFVKVSLGSEEMLKWEYKKEIPSVIRELKDNGFQILSLEQREDSQDLKHFSPKDQFALIVGNEVTGVSQVALEASDAVIEIPMQGGKESLNVSVATGIALFMLI